jgi:hypothetical protein
MNSVKLQTNKTSLLCWFPSSFVTIAILRDISKSCCTNANTAATKVSATIGGHGADGGSVSKSSTTGCTTSKRYTKMQILSVYFPDLNITESIIASGTTIIFPMQPV